MMVLASLAEVILGVVALLETTDDQRNSLDLYRTIKTMQTTIDINEGLLQKAMDMGHITDKKEVVELALQAYIDNQARLKLLSLFGSAEWEGDLEQMRTDNTPNDWDQ
jgi:Arc/MetJ family transcription regulator